MSRYHFATAALDGPDEADIAAVRDAVAKAKKWTLDSLRRLGIHDMVTVKVKRFAKSPNWLAMYRSNTQFGRNPIFWINENILDVMREADVPDSELLKVVYDSLLHEYGHVIWEWARARDADTYKTLFWGNKTWGGEEEFAEGFVQFALNGLGKEGYAPVVEAFTAKVFAPAASAGGQLRLECLCADDFGAGRKDDLTAEDTAHIENYEATRAAQLAMAEEAESRGIEHYVSDSDDRDSRHSDAYLYFPPSRLAEVAEMLAAVGLEGDVLDVPEGFTDERRLHGWTVEEHGEPDWQGA